MDRPVAWGSHTQQGKEVQLGLPGAWVDAKSNVNDHYTTKIGGQPDWPISLQPNVANELLKCAVCGVCGGYMGLVAQVHAPLVLNGITWNERTIYVFGCPAAGCGVDPACWRTIRLQKEIEKEEADNDAFETEILSTTPEATHALAIGTVKSRSEMGEPSSAPMRGPEGQSFDWWADSLWSETLDGEPIDDQTKITSVQELESALREAGQLAISSQESRGTNGILQTTGMSGTPNQNFPVLPSFYIYFQTESLRSTPSSTEPVQTVLHDEDSGDPLISLEPVGEIWAAEVYEHDQALHADRTYLRFKKHLDCCPEQCLRYSFDGQVLWAVKETRGAGRCASCGGPRVYEMQLMPPLLYFLEQANKELPPHSFGPDEWDWFTLIVFTCAQSCLQKVPNQVTHEENKGWSIVEEATILQQEFRSVAS